MSLLEKEPVKVQRMTRSKIEIISSESAIKMQDRYDRFANFVLSYGGSIVGCKFTTTSGNVDGAPWETYHLCIFYSVPINVSDKLLLGAYEKQ